MSIHVGIDVGGTFTDAVAIADGRAVRGKAFSTADVTSGILAALEVLQNRLAISEKEFFDQVTRFVLGNTIVTNAVDEMKFASVALITTQGFGDTLGIARSARGTARDPHDLKPRPDIVARQSIFELGERVDSSGRLLVAAGTDEIASIVKRGLGQGVKSFAVCLLWSFRNDVNERAVAAYLDTHHPDVPYTLSSALTPVYREYERMVTTALDAAVKPVVANHFRELAMTLQRRGLNAPVQIMQVHGGFLSVEETTKAPIAMFNSGPVGGVTGARLLGREIGRSKILTADMGGTSLDAAAIIDGEMRILPRAQVGHWPTSLTAVDIESIGAGGGSIAWIDGRGLLRVGPHSAGSRPGPACYGAGGDEPTVTDATLALGLINPDYYLAGAVKLDASKAELALESHVATALGLSVDQAALGVYRLMVSQMSNALRKITVNRGHDPREFTMVAFGGACGLFAAAIAEESGVEEVIIPRNAAVFSADGLLHADSVLSAVQTTPWSFDRPAADLENAFIALEERANAWFEHEQIPEDRRVIHREADMKFAGQIFEVTTKLSPNSFDDSAKAQLRNRFIEDYESEFGAGTAWTDAEILLINSRVRAVGISDVQPVVERDGDASHLSYEREIFDPSSARRRKIDVHRGFSQVGIAKGPCILEEPDTTIYVPEGSTIELIDEQYFLIRLASSINRPSES